MSNSKNILILLGFLFLSHFIFTQKSQHKSHVENLWNDVSLEIDAANLSQVKITFNKFGQYCIDEGLDSLLSSKIKLVGKYYAQESEYFERIKWYQYAVDSLCSKKFLHCIEIRRRLSDIFLYVGKHDSAIELIKENLDFFKNEGSLAAITQEYFSLAEIQRDKGDFDMALEYYEKALAVVNESNSPFYKVLARNNLGVFLSQTNHLQEAAFYFRQGIEYLNSLDTLVGKQPNQLALLKGNLGGILIQYKDSAKVGEVLLKEDMHFGLEEGEIELGFNAAIELSKYYRDKGDYYNANLVLNECLHHPRTKKLSELRQYSLVPLYYQLFLNKLDEGSTHSALKYYNSYDSLNKIEESQTEKNRIEIEKSLLENILNAQISYQRQQKELKEKENKVLQEKNKYYQFRLIFGVSALIIVIIALILYGRKRIVLFRTRKELAENRFEMERLEREKKEVELKYKNKDLTDFAIDISRKQDVLAEVKIRLSEIRNQKWDDDEYKDEIKSLILYTNNNMIVDDQLKEFQENIEELNYKFFDTLKKQFPELTELDKQVCGLIRLGLSNKEIATMRNVSYKAIRMSRYRIRKKLKLPAELDMVEFLKSME